MVEKNIKWLLWETSNPWGQRNMRISMIAKMIKERYERISLLKQAKKEIQIEIADIEKKIYNLEVERWHLETDTIGENEIDSFPQPPKI